MTPTERRKRIAEKNRLRLATAARHWELRDEMLAEVEAAKADPEAQLPYRRAAEVLGVSWQVLNAMLQSYRERTARQERTG